MQVLVKNRINYYPNAISKENADILYDVLLKSNWQRENIMIGGRECTQNRDTCSYSKDGKTYSYHGVVIKPELFNESINTINEVVQTLTKQECDYFLCNKYTPDDSIGWHADDVKNLDAKASIISVSLGQTRTFVVRHKRSDFKMEVKLNHGDILEMLPGTQEEYLHSVPKVPKKERKEPTIMSFFNKDKIYKYRISLTGRKLK